MIHHSESPSKPSTPSPRQKKIRHEQQRSRFLEKIGSPGSLLFSNSALPLHWSPKTRDALRQQRGRFRGDSRRCLWGKCTVRRIHIYRYTLLFEKTFATLYNKYIYIMIWNLSIPRRKSLKHDYEQTEHDIRHVCQDIFSVNSEFLRFPFNLCLWEVPQ